MRLRKRTIAVTTAAFVIAGTTAALAFWTTGGSGTGTTTTASATAGVVLSATVTGGPLVPGGSQDIAVTAENPNNAVVELGEISFTVHTADEQACSPANFSIASLPGGSVSALATADSLGSATLEFLDTGVNQDGCKGVEVSFDMTASAPVGA